MRISAAFAAAAIVCAATTATAETAAPGPVASEVQTFANYLSARQAASDFDLKQASQYYAASLADDPNNKDILSKAFIYAASSGDFEGGANLAKRVLAQTPDNKLAQLVLVIDEIKHGNYKDARAALKPEPGGANPAGPTMLLMTAWAAFGAGDTDAAYATLDTLKGLGSADAIVDYHRALMLDLQGQTNDADTAYRKALLDVGPAPRVVDAYGRFLERTGHAADATALYTKLESETALLPILKAGEARIAANRKPDPLIGDAKAGAAEALFGIGASLTDNSTADLAILYLHGALYLRSDLELARILLADRFENLHKYDEALAIYREVGKDSLYWRISTVQEAIDLSRLNKNDEAAATLKGLTASDPSDLEAWTALGDIYRAMERYPDATEAYNQALKIAPANDKNNWQLYYARAVAEQQANNWPAAEADLQMALKLSPEEPDVLNNLGYSWIEKKQNIPQAMVMLEKARTLRPFDGYIVDSVGWAYYRLGKYDDAAKTLLNAVLLVPGDPTINEHLGDAYWRVGKKLDAQFQWSHALAFATDDKTKPALQEKLKDGLPPTDVASAAK